MKQIPGSQVHIFPTSLIYLLSSNVCLSKKTYVLKIGKNISSRLKLESTLNASLQLFLSLSKTLFFKLRKIHWARSYKADSICE